MEEQYFFEDEEKGSFLSRGGEREFEVSFDGSFTRDFEGTEFIVSLPIINGMEHAEVKDYLGGGIAVQRFLGLSDSGEEKSSKEEQSPPSYMRKIAWAWERRALRAEESLKRYQEGMMDRTGEGKLKDTLSFLLNSDAGIIDERKPNLSGYPGGYCTVPAGTAAGTVLWVLR